MQELQSIRPIMAVLVSLVASFLILASDKRPNLREFWTMAAAVAKFSIVASMLPSVISGKIVVCRLMEIFPGIWLELKADSFGLFFALLSSFLWIATSSYSIGYMRGLSEHAQTRYFFNFAIALSATMGIAMAGNLITFYIFYEMLTVSTYPLVVHKESPEAIRAGRKYLFYTMSAGVIFLFAIIMTYHIAGTLDFRPGGFLAGKAPSDTLKALFITFIIGCGVKAAFMPMHSWLPTAMIAPTPVSALLHAVAVVKAGVFGCLRIILFVFGPQLLHQLDIWLGLAYFVSFTIIIASLFALGQDNLKRRLAFSTISQLSYIVLGAALLSPKSMTGGIMHIANHAFMKITLFFCAGAIYVVTKKENISELDGIGRRMPVTMGAFTLASMGMAGMPPFCGFVSKWLLCAGAMEAKEAIFVIILVTSGLLNVAYFFPIVYRAFFRGSAEAATTVREAPLTMVIPISFAAVMSLALGVYPDLFFRFMRLASMSVGSILHGG